MKLKLLIIALIVYILSLANCNAQNEKEKTCNFSNLKGQYLGEEPPGTTPKLFASSIFKQVAGNSVHSSPSFSSDGKEMYYTIMPTEGPFVIKYMKMIGENWTNPETVKFTKGIDGNNSLFANSDDIILFKSLTPRYNKQNILTLWKVERENGIWGKPHELDPIFDNLAMGVSITNSGTIYFTLAKEGYGSHDIYRSQLINGKYSNPEKLCHEINSDGDDWQPYVAPDESYLIFSRYKGAPKKGIINLYISFKQTDGYWSEALNMGKAINEKDAAWPYVSPDGKYIFFVSSKDNDSWFYKVYWVDARIIEILKSEID